MTSQQPNRPSHETVTSYIFVELKTGLTRKVFNKNPQINYQINLSTYAKTLTSLGYIVFFYIPDVTRLPMPEVVENNKKSGTK